VNSIEKMVKIRKEKKSERQKRKQEKKQGIEANTHESDQNSHSI
jgi:hypothetical protein